MTVAVVADISAAWCECGDYVTNMKVNERTLCAQCFKQAVLDGEFTVIVGVMPEPQERQDTVEADWS